jgi:hypothetical protein
MACGNLGVKKKKNLSLRILLFAAHLAQKECLSFQQKHQIRGGYSSMIRRDVNAWVKCKESEEIVSKQCELL